MNFDVPKYQYDINGNPVSQQPTTQTTQQQESRGTAPILTSSSIEGDIGDNTSFSSSNTTQSSNVYVVKAGDTLGKIAQMFNTSIDVIMAFNPDIKNPNKIRVGQEIKLSGAEINATDKAIAFIKKKQKERAEAEANNKLEDYTKQEEARRALNKRGSALSSILSLYNPDDLKTAQTLSEEQFNKTIEILKNEYHVHAGLTRQEAEKIGGDVLKDFNKICPEGHDVITEEDIILAKNKDLNDAGISIASIFKTINSAEGIDRVKIYQKLTSIVANEDEVIDKFKDINSKEDLMKALQLKPEELQEAGNDPKKIGKLIGEKFKQELMSAMNVDDENSLIVQEMRRLERGDFNEDELARGHQKGQGIKDPKKLFELATQNIGKQYISTITHLSQKAFADTDDNVKLAAIHGLFESLESSDETRRLLQALGIESITNQKLKEEAAQDVYDHEKDNLNFEDISGFALTGTLFGNGSLDLIQQIFSENSDNIDALKTIAQGVIESMPDGDKKEALRALVETVTGGSSTINGGKPTGKPQQEPVVRQDIAPQQPKVTNPIEEMKRLSKEWLKDNQLNHVSPREQARAEFLAKMEEIHKEIRAKMRMEMIEISNLPPVLALNVLVEHYDQMPGFIKEKFVGYVSRMASAYSDLMCEVFMNGSDDTKKFLKEKGIVTETILFSNFDKNPSSFNNAPKEYQIKYMASRSKEYQKKQV